MVRSLAHEEKQGDASDLDKLAEVVRALTDRVLKQEREIQQVKQEVKDKEMRCKNAKKLLHQRFSELDDMHEKKFVALEQVVSASSSEHDGEDERAKMSGHTQQRISELEVKLMGQSKRIELVEEMISAQFGTLDEGKVERMQTGLGISINQNCGTGGDIFQKHLNGLKDLEVKVSSLEKNVGSLCERQMSLDKDSCRLNIVVGNFKEKGSKVEDKLKLQGLWQRNFKLRLT